MTRDQILEIVRAKLAAAAAAAPTPTPRPTPTAAAAAPATAQRAPEPVEAAITAAVEAATLVNKELVDRARANGKRIAIAPGAIVTPLARELAEKEGVALVEVGPAPPRKPATAPDAHSPRPAANPRQLAIGSDHGGYALKRELLDHLRGLGFQVSDLGTHDGQSVDYPDIAHRVARAVVDGQASRGIVIDGAGIGSAITANKVPGIRAAHCHNLFEVRNSREHNDANVLSLGGRVIGGELAKAMVTLWLETAFGGGRHQRRVDKIKQVEGGYLRA